MSDLEEVNHHNAKELIHIANWMQKNSTQQAKQIEEEAKEKTLGAHIKLVACCPDSKPFWINNNHELQYSLVTFHRRERRAINTLRRSHG
jgi:hypothetical protein